MGTMDTKVSTYVPYCFRQFQGFSVKDLKEFPATEVMEIHLVSNEDRVRCCGVCGVKLGNIKDRYWVRARHLKVFNWLVTVCFFREKRHCPTCRKVRSEFIEWICPTSPHMTVELAWWVSRMTEVTTVLAVSRLENLDKMAAYKVDHYILKRLLQGYTIPKVKRISVDEVYARSKKQMKEGENRDDLFLTIVTDMQTRKVIWVSQGRSKKALDQFFELLGPEACRDIEVVATDQHDAYGASVEAHCRNATIVWDRFHLVQKFNEALNEERKFEWENNVDPEGELGDLVSGKYRYLFLARAYNRSEKDKLHIDEVMQKNARLAKLELVKENFHRMFDQPTLEAAQTKLCECYEWAYQAKAHFITKWIMSIMDQQRFWSYWLYKATTGVSEGINRAIKGLKWQAYGYKNMDYFALKIMQKCGYLNYRHYLASIRIE
jgi:transposase